MENRYDLTSSGDKNIKQYQNQDFYVIIIYKSLNIGLG